MFCLDCGKWFEDSRHSDVPICQECRTDIALSQDEEIELAKDDVDEHEYNSYLREAKSAGASPLTLSEWLTNRERMV